VWTVFENDTVKAFLDIHPASKGHTLVIPKQLICCHAQRSIGTFALRQRWDDGTVQISHGVYSFNYCIKKLEKKGYIKYNKAQGSGQLKRKLKTKLNDTMAASNKPFL
jgi:Ribonuclease G/E